MVESTVALVPAAALHHKMATHGPVGHVCETHTQKGKPPHRNQKPHLTVRGSPTVHVAVSPPGASSPSAPEPWLPPSTPASSVKVSPSVGPSPHRLLPPVVVAIASALTGRRAHHARASARVKGGSVAVRGRRVVEARAAGGTVGRVAAVHGHLHVHVVHVVHVVHTRPVARQTLVHCTTQHKRTMKLKHNRTHKF